MRDHLKELVMLGIANVKEENKGRKGGIRYKYSIDMPTEIVLSALENTVKQVGIHESIKEKIDIEN